MKQVVINGENSYGQLLPEKWVAEYCKRKGIDIYAYVVDEVLGDKISFKIKDASEIDETEVCAVYYLSENLGEVITGITDDMRQKIIYEHELFRNREDKVLIDIAKEINDTNLVKIVEIPDDVEYDICRLGSGIHEYIVEKHRVWR